MNGAPHFVALSELPPRVRRCSLLAITITLSLVSHSRAAAQDRLPLSPADVANIVTLEKIEDRRDYDATALAQIAASKHRELRRRAALAIARLYDPRGRELLHALRGDADTVVLATVVWATGQLVDTVAVGWLDSLLQRTDTPVGVATEAAGAFGKIRTADTRRALSQFLSHARPSPNASPVVAEALLSMGRHGKPADTAAIARWIRTPDVQLRWRAAWALFRPRDAAAQPLLIELARDTAAEVRFWAVRGLARTRADGTLASLPDTGHTILRALRDNDRRVRTEAVRALGSYPDGSSNALLVAALDDRDPWIAVSAAAGIGTRGEKARGAIPALLKAAHSHRSAWIRAAALTALADVSLPASIVPATVMARDTSLTVRTAAVDVLGRLKVAGRAGLAVLKADPDRDVRAAANTAMMQLADTTDDLAARRVARQPAFASRDVAVRAAAARSIAAWADASDIPALLDAFAVALTDTALLAQDATIETLAEIQSRGADAASPFFARFTTAPSDIAYGIAGRAFGPKTLAAWGNGRPIRSFRTDDDYTRIVGTLVVPAYNGAAAPRLRWETTRGAVYTELNPLDAPLATDYLLALTAKGAMRRIRFERVVPNFVAQQRAVLASEPLQRDEISRGRLVRGNLSWGSNIGNAPRFPGMRGPGAAYDTGPAVYTFGQTPQPHNEGDFTALGRIVIGMDVVDRMELGDYVTSVRRVKPGAKSARLKGSASTPP